VLVFSQGVFEQEWHFGYHLKQIKDKQNLDEDKHETSVRTKHWQIFNVFNVKE
jgi:hypothetical protein